MTVSIDTGKIDFAITLCDLNNVGGDEAFVIPTIAWFPSHTGEPDLARRRCEPDAVAALSPSDARSIGRNYLPRGSEDPARRRRPNACQSTTEMCECRPGHSRRS